MQHADTAGFQEPAKCESRVFETLPAVSFLVSWGRVGGDHGIIEDYYPWNFHTLFAELLSSTRVLRLTEGTVGDLARIPPGRPHPSARCGGTGIRGLMRAHCSLVSSARRAML